MLAISALLLLAVSCVADNVYQTSHANVVLGADNVVNKLECNLTMPVVFYMQKKGEKNVTNDTTLGPLNRDFKQVEKIEGKTLYFEQVQLKDPIGLEEYDYMCEKLGGTTNIKFNISILPRCKVEDNSKKLSVTVGAFRELVCMLLTGNYSNTQWHWEKDGRVLNSTDASKYKFVVRNHESMLKIMNVEKSDHGNYSCVLTNDYGVHSQTIEFQVIGVFDSLLYYLIVCGQVAAVTIGFLIWDKKSQKKRNQEEDESSRSAQRVTRS